MSNNVLTALLRCNQYSVDKISDALRLNGFQTRIVHGQIYLWKPGNALQIDKNLFYVDGFIIGKIWLGKRSHKNNIKILGVRLELTALRSTI